MDIKTIGTRREERWVAAYDQRPGEPTRRINKLVVENNRQAILNDEEAAWLLKNYPHLEWLRHSEGDLMVIIDGLRYRITDKQLEASKPGEGSAPYPETSHEMTREEIQEKAQSLGIKSNQKSKVLLKLIDEAESSGDEE